MKAHTNDFKNEIKIFGRQLNSIISYSSGGIDYELSMEELNSITPHFESSILKSAMRGLEIDSNVEIPKDTIINYQFGVKVRDATENDDGFDYINYGDYIVKDVEKQEDTNSYRIIAYDYMLKSMVDYEAMEITYPITIRDYINAICEHLELEFKNINDTFPNYNRMIQNELYLDSDGKSLGYTFRDVLDELSAVTASTICIDLETNELELRYITDTEDTIDEEFLKDTNVNFGESFGPINTIVLSRAAESDNIYKSYPEDLPDDEKVEIKIIDNQIMNFNDRADYLPDILNQLYGLEYSIHDFSSTGICYYDICDRYNVQIGENIYSCVMFNDEVDITQGLQENIYTDMPKNTNTDYTKADKDDRKINQIYLIVDKQNGIIESLVEKIVDVSDIKTGNGSVQLENASEGILYKLSISGQISLLFPQNENDLYGYPLVPSDNLVPSNELVPSSPVPYQNEILYPNENLYPKSSILLIDNVEYKLDFDFLNYMNSSVHDEFVYENGECRIIRRVGIDENGDMYALDNEVIEQRQPIELFVKSDSIIQLKSFDNTILSATYLLENEYTDVFATKVDVNSQFRQTNNKIEASVKSVADENGEITSGSIMLALNKDESNIKLQADKIALEGYTTINGNFKIDENGDMEVNNGKFNGLINAGSIEVKGYTEQDPYISMGDFESQYPHGTIMWDNGISVINYEDGGDAVIRTEVVGGFAELSGSVVNAYGFNNVSLFEKKKDFEKLKSGLDIIKNIDIYKYLYKNENQEKKHIGIVIGDKYKYSKDITNDKNDAIDLYSFVAVCCKAIQEQQVEIENLKEEMEELKNGFNRI